MWKWVINAGLVYTGVSASYTCMPDGDRATWKDEHNKRCADYGSEALCNSDGTEGVMFFQYMAEHAATYGWGDFYYWVGRWGRGQYNGLNCPECGCEPGLDRTTFSCEHKHDISDMAAEGGQIRCPADHTIDITSAYLTRKNPAVCSKGSIGADKKTKKLYTVCDEMHPIWNYIENKCNGQESCDYKFYADGDDAGEVPAKRYNGNNYRPKCNKPRRNRYMIVNWTCVPPRPTVTPPVDEDICVSCAATGFTTEKSCRFDGLDYGEDFFPSMEADHAACLAQCKSLPICVGFTFFDEPVDVNIKNKYTAYSKNCLLKVGLLNKITYGSTYYGPTYTFSRKCELSECAGGPGPGTCMPDDHYSTWKNMNNRSCGDHASEALCNADGTEGIGFNTEAAEHGASLTGATGFEFWMGFWGKNQYSYLNCPECGCKLAPCDTSKIPFLVNGPHSWDCTETAGTKTCNPRCSDGFNKLHVSVSCSLEDDKWILLSAPDTVDEYAPGCQTCSTDINTMSEFNIAAGGTWECTESESRYTDKICLPKCPKPLPKPIKGKIVCDRKNNGDEYFHFKGHLADTERYVADKQMTRSINRGLSCFIPEKCDTAEFMTKLTAEYADHGLVRSDFDVDKQGKRGYIAWRLCDDNTVSRATFKCINKKSGPVYKGTKTLLKPQNKLPGCF